MANEAWDKMKYSCERKYVQAMKRIGKIVGWTLLVALGVGLLALLTIQFTIPSFQVDHYVSPYDEAGQAVQRDAQARMDQAALWVGRCVLWPINVAWVLVVVGTVIFGVAAAGVYGFGWLFGEAPVLLCAWWHMRKAHQTQRRLRKAKRP